MQCLSVHAFPLAAHTKAEPVANSKGRQLAAPAPDDGGYGAAVGVQDPQGRTALHVAATCGAIEVVSILCKSNSANVNPVDAYASTPLDNANMVGDAAIAALLKEAGGLCGSAPILSSRLQETREWIQQQGDRQQELRRAEILSDLPEQHQAAAAAAIAHLQREFVQVLATLA